MEKNSVKGGYPGKKLVKNGPIYTIFWIVAIYQNTKQNWYGLYFRHDENVCQVREKSEMVLFRNIQYGQNGQNGHEMAKIKKCIFFTPKIVLLFINYIISTFYSKYL